MTSIVDITEEDIVACWGQYAAQYLAEVLNGTYPLETAQEDLRSLIGSEHDPRERAETPTDCAVYAQALARSLEDSP
jgi:hypothetical protein